MNEGNYSEMKTKGTDRAEAEKKPPAGLGDQSMGWGEEGWLGGGLVQHGSLVSPGCKE